MADELNGVSPAQPDKADVLKDTPPPGRKKRRSVRRKLLYGLGGLVLVCCLLVGLGALRLWLSPLSVSSLLTQIEEAVVDQLPAGQMLDIEDAQISLSESGSLALRLSGVKLSEGGVTTSVCAADRSGDRAV
ncbi:hypothetical protein [uncultured Cohaesibacter sp.]|uniref:hypothetical protein n=1 Tax=uncultured Cohaesibacter sp. TaxID=1002546 RepID=UPI0029C6E8F7|nr:hypothetical protein [uncultured Cohaesibacter sp.]